MGLVFITSGHEVIDFDLDLLVEILGVVDRQIAMIEVAISRCPDPDGFGHLDRLEGIIGLGFVACQQYINATYGQLAISKDEKRWQVVASPRLHSCGRAFAEITDAAANYWKHHDEWPGAENKGHEARTREAIEALTPSTVDYVLSNILHDLARPKQPRFSSVIYELKLWRDLRIKATA